MISDWDRARVERLHNVQMGSLWRIQDEFGRLYFSIEPGGRCPCNESVLLTPEDFRRVAVVVREEVEIELEREIRDKRLRST